MQQLRQWIRNHRRELAAAALWVSIAFAIQTYMQTHDLTLRQVLDDIGTFLLDTWYGPLIYIFSYALRPLTLIPGTPFTVLGGYLYGLFPGGIYALLGGLLSAQIPYWFGRLFGDEASLEEHINDDDNRFWRIVGGLRKRPFQTVLTTRLMYLPYDTVNFIIGTLQINFSMYMLGTLLGNAIPAVAGAGIGASIKGDFAQGNISLDPAVLVLSLVILVISLGISQWINRYHIDDSQRTQGA